MSGKLQYQFKGQRHVFENAPNLIVKERNYVLHFSGLFSLIATVLKAMRKRPDGIYIFFDHK